MANINNNSNPNANNDASRKSKKASYTFDRSWRQHYQPPKSQPPLLSGTGKRLITASQQALLNSKDPTSAEYNNGLAVQRASRKQSQQSQRRQERAEARRFSFELGQDNIVEFIKAYIVRYNYSPEIREIQLALGISSSSLCRARLIKLREQGRLCFEDNRARTIRLPGQRIIFAEDYPPAPDLPTFTNGV